MSTPMWMRYIVGEARGNKVWNDRLNALYLAGYALRKEVDIGGKHLPRYVLCRIDEKKSFSTGYADEAMVTVDSLDELLPYVKLIIGGE